MKNHGNKVISDIKVNQVIGGMRGLPCMFYLGSSLDEIEGIEFRGHSIPSLQ